MVQGCYCKPCWIPANASLFAASLHTSLLQQEAGPVAVSTDKSGVQSPTLTIHQHIAILGQRWVINMKGRGGGGRFLSQWLIPEAWTDFNLPFEQINSVSFAARLSLPSLNTHWTILINEKSRNKPVPSVFYTAQLLFQFQLTPG